jgi:hypothetical protein
VSIANRKLLQCMSQLLALSVSSSAPEIRTLLEVKRTSGEALGCVRLTRMTHSGHGPARNAAVQQTHAITLACYHLSEPGSAQYAIQNISGLPQGLASPSAAG